MKINFEIEGIQEGKRYILEFCLSSDGQVVVSNTTPSKSSGPTIEEFEEKKENGPTLEEPKIEKKKDFNIQSSFDGKINPN
jgi:hypothetical protein